MSGSLPTTLAPTRVSLRSLYPSRVSIAQSLKTLTRSLGVQRWLLMYEWELLSRDQFAELNGFLLKQRGQYDTFTVVPPGIAETPRGSFPGAPLVNGAHAAGAQTVALDGLTPSQSNVARAGDFIKFNAHAKIYMITADANSDGGGAATIAIEPMLMASVANNEPIVTSNVPFTVGLANDTLEIQMRAPIFGALQIDMMERP